MLNTIIQGDCLEVMRTMPSESVDVVVTSPPYNIKNTNPLYRAIIERNLVIGDCLLINNIKHDLFPDGSKVSQEARLPKYSDFIFHFTQEHNLSDYCEKFLQKFLGLSEGNDYKIHGRAGYMARDFPGYPDIFINIDGLFHDRLYIEFKAGRGKLRETQTYRHEKLKEDNRNDVHVVTSFWQFLKVIGNYFVGDCNIFHYPMFIERLYINQLLKHAYIYKSFDRYLIVNDGVFGFFGDPKKETKYTRIVNAKFQSS